MDRQRPNFQANRDAAVATTVQTFCDFLEQFAPTRLAEEWDNVGLLVGDREQAVERVMMCLTVTPSSVSEAVDEHVDLIVTHHPMPFHPLKRITTDTVAGRLLTELIRSETAVYSPHTAFDSAAAGINQRLAEGLGIVEIAPLEPADDDTDNTGSGRFGRLAEKTTVGAVAERLKQFLSIDAIQMVGDTETAVERIAVGCGSAGQLLDSARRVGCDLFITGETSFHTCLDAEATDTTLLLVGHFASERFAVEELAEVLAGQFTALTIWASRRESNPLKRI